MCPITIYSIKCQFMPYTNQQQNIPRYIQFRSATIFLFYIETEMRKGKCQLKSQKRNKRLTRQAAGSRRYQQAFSEFNTRTLEVLVLYVCYVFHILRACNFTQFVSLQIMIYLILLLTIVLEHTYGNDVFLLQIRQILLCYSFR